MKRGVDNRLVSGHLVEKRKANDWQIYTRNHYKIWFSNNPKQFLDIENQLRFVKLCSQNPQLRFSLIYSSKCLTQVSIEELKSFCRKFNIIPLDFHLDFEKEKQTCSEDDKQLFKLAEIEINKTIANEGGSFAASSDIIRLIITVIEKCGIYCDFEPEMMDLSTTPDWKQVSSPIILKYNNKTKELNNDFLAVSSDTNELKITQEALEMITNAQRQLLANYNNFPKQVIVHSFYPSYLCPFSTAVIESYFDKNSKASIFDLRKYISEADFFEIVNLNEDIVKAYIGCSSEDAKKFLSIEDMKKNFGLTCNPKSKNPVETADLEFEQIKNNMLKITVIPFSGPEVINAFFKGKYNYLIDKASYKNCMDKFYVENSLPNSKFSENLYDSSWTDKGLEEKLQRGNDINNRILSIQSHCRRFNAKIKLNELRELSHDVVDKQLKALVITDKDKDEAKLVKQNNHNEGETAIDAKTPVITFAFAPQERTNFNIKGEAEGVDMAEYHVEDSDNKKERSFFF